MRRRRIFEISELSIYKKTAEKSAVFLLNIFLPWRNLMARWRNINTVVRDGDGGEDGEDDGDKGRAHPSRTIPSNSTAGLPWRLQ